MPSLSEVIKNCDSLEAFTELMRPQYKIEGNVKAGTAKRVAEEGSEGIFVQLGCCAGKSYSHTRYTGTVPHGVVLHKFDSLIKAILSNTLTKNETPNNIDLIVRLGQFHSSFDNETELLLSQNIFKRICYWIIQIFNKIFCVASTLDVTFNRRMKAATAEYRKEMDTIGKRLESCLVINEQQVALSKKLSSIISNIDKLKTTEETPSRNKKIESLKLEGTAISEKMRKNLLRIQEFVQNTDIAKLHSPGLKL